MDKKIRQVVLKYIRRLKEVTRGQVINEVSKQNNYERIQVQEAINLLLDDKLISIIGLADTFALTNKGHKQMELWYKRINWLHHIIKIISYIIVFLLGLFAEEVKSLILLFFR